jgi:hypothetical protein
MEAAVKQTTKYIIGTTLIRHRRTTEIRTCKAASRHITPFKSAILGRERSPSPVFFKAIIRLRI